MKLKFNYDESEDILDIIDTSKVIKHSMGVSDVFVVDFDDKDKVIGLEVLDASEVIAGVSKKILKNIEDIQLKVSYKPDMIIVGFKIKSKATSEVIHSSVPLLMAKARA